MRRARLPCIVFILISLNSWSFTGRSIEINRDSLLISGYLDSARTIFQKDLPAAMLYLDSAGTLAGTGSMWHLAAKSEETAGIILRFHGDFVLAKERFQRALILYKDHGNLSEASLIEKKLGDLYSDMGDYASSMDAYVEGCKLAEKANDLYSLAFCYRGISMLYYQLHEPEKSLDNINKALSIFMKTEYDSLDLTDMWHTKAIALKENGNIDSAIYLYEQSAIVNRKLNELSSVAGNLNNLALIYENQQEYDKALQYYHQCLQIDIEKGDTFGMTYSHIGCANVYLKTGQLDSALYHAKTSLRLATDLAATHRILKASESLLEIYKARQEYDSALLYAESVAVIRDSLYQTEKVKTALELETRYESRKKENEIILLNEQKDSAIFRRNVYVLIGVILIAFLGMISYQQRLKATKNRQLLAKEKEMDQLKSRFFANISHEFRTPLTLILGPLDDILSNDKAPSLNPELKIMSRNAQRLLDLINQLLELSKIETGKLKIHTQNSDIISLIRSTAMAFHSLAELKQITMDLDVTDEFFMMNFDKEKVQTILTNILANAFKFTPEKGRIQVTAETPNTQDDAPCITIKVKDSGQGIAEVDLEHIFNRFYQSDSNQLHQNEGSGIGLALSKELVELHDGTITANSVPDHGTEIIIRLPVNLPLSSTDHHLVSSKEKIKHISSSVPVVDEIGDTNQTVDKSLVLVIEDNVDVCKYIKKTLADDFSVITAENGEEGISKALEIIPDLIVSDVMMPKKNGYEVCDLLKNNEKTSHIPIILLTAKAELDDRMVGLSVKADNYLSKPFVPRELHLRISNLIDSRNKLKEKYKKTGVLSPKEITVNSVDENFLNKLVEITEDHISDDKFGVTELGHAIHMSRSQLHRKLTALLGHGPNEFIRTFRLKRAYQLLKQKSATISEVAFNVGFSSPSYFTKCFHEYYGFTPTDMMV